MDGRLAVIHIRYGDYVYESSVGQVAGYSFGESNNPRVKWAASSRTAISRTRNVLKSGLNVKVGESAVCNPCGDLVGLEVHKAFGFQGVYVCNFIFQSLHVEHSVRGRNYEVIQERRLRLIDATY